MFVLCTNVNDVFGYNKKVTNFFLNFFSVGTKKTKSTNRKQDSFDKAFIQILEELQGMGYCKNVSALEKFLKIPKQTLYQVLSGSRGIPLIHRDKVLKFFTGRYDINPSFFHNQQVPLFKNDPPIVSEPDEKYLTVSNQISRNRLTTGDMREYEMLKAENERLHKTVQDRDKVIKNMQLQINSMQRLLDKLSA